MSNPSRVLWGLVPALLGVALLAGCSNGSGGASIASVNGENISKTQLDSKLEDSAASKSFISCI